MKEKMKKLTRIRKHYELPCSEEEYQNNIENACRHICQHIGSYIKMVRTNKKVSLRDIYRLTNVSIAITKDLESGKKLPKIETIVKIALVLDIKMEKLFGDRIFPNNFKELFEGSDIYKLKVLREELEICYGKEKANEIINYVKYTTSNS